MLNTYYICAKYSYWSHSTAPAAHLMYIYCIMQTPLTGKHTLVNIVAFLVDLARPLDE